jgi:hypothetical protein
MTQLTAEKANKLLKEVQDKEKFDTKLKKAIIDAEIIVDNILIDIEKAIYEEKVSFITKDLTEVNRLCFIEVTRKLNSLGYIVTSNMYLSPPENKLFVIKISWGVEKYNKDEFDSLNIFSHVHFKNLCKQYNQPFLPYFMFRETN